MLLPGPVLAAEKNKRPAPPGRIACALLALLACAACSYRLVRDSAAPLPAELEGFSVPLARNLTIEAGLEDMFTMELKNRLAADGRVKLEDPRRSEAELVCTLSDFSVRPVSYTKQGRVAAERVSFRAECRLAMRESGSILFATGPLSASEEYAIGPDYLANERNKAQATQEVCRDLAETVRQLLLDRF